MAPKAKKRPAKRLAPRTKPGGAQSGSLTVLPMPRRVAGVPINEQTALTCASVWACVRVISEGLAKLPWRVFEELPGGGRRKRNDLNVDYLLNAQANPEMTAFQFRETALAHLLCYGNAYAEIEFDLIGRPLWLWLITPDRVRVTRDGLGRVVYIVRNQGAPDTPLYADEMLHFKGLGFDGLVGYSVIAMAARVIGGALAADQAANDFFENGVTPVGFLKHPTRLSDLAKTNLEKSWQRKYGSAGNRYKTPVLEEGLEWVPGSLPPADAQILQTRQFTPLEICRFFRMQPHKIAELSRATFSNIESQDREHVDDTLMPWAVRLEQEVNLKLLGQQRFYTKHNFAALLRGNSVDRANFYGKLSQMGALTINEIRELEDQNPIGPDGDARFVPVNMQTLENAIAAPPPQAPAPATPPAQQPENDGADQSPEEAAMRSPLFPLVREACGRVLRREAACIAAIEKKHKSDEARALAVEKFRSDHADHLREAMAASAAAVAGDDAETVLEQWIASYLQGMESGSVVAADRDLARELAWYLFSLANARKEHSRAAA